jgi:TolB-like protein
MGGEKADIDAALQSKIPHVLVIARNSTGACKGQPAKIQKIAEELAVRGSTRGVGEK